MKYLKIVYFHLYHLIVHAVRAIESAAERKLGLETHPFPLRFSLGPDGPTTTLVIHVSVEPSRVITGNVAIECNNTK